MCIKCSLGLITLLQMFLHSSHPKFWLWTTHSRVCHFPVVIILPRLLLSLPGMRTIGLWSQQQGSRMLLSSWRLLVEHLLYPSSSSFLCLLSAGDLCKDHSGLWFLHLFRWRSFSDEDDNSSNRSIIYNIEQDKVTISPVVEKHMQVKKMVVRWKTDTKIYFFQHILLLDDITGLLPPSLKALRSAHAITCGIAMRNIIIRNIKDLETLQKAIKHIPIILDAAMDALVETNVKPAEAEVSMQHCSI